METQYFGGDTNANPNATAANGINTGLEAYIAGLNPTNPASRFIVSNDWKTLGWNAVSGRVYSVYWTTKLLNSFQPLETNTSGRRTADRSDRAGRCILSDPCGNDPVKESNCRNGICSDEEVFSDVDISCGVVLLTTAVGAETLFPESWEAASPESQGVDAQQLTAAMSRMAGITGSDGSSQTMVVRHGRVIWKGDWRSTAGTISFCTKSFFSLWRSFAH